MNDLSCPVVRDLLPLYAEGLASEETASLVEAHLGACPDCRAALEAVRAPAELPADASAPLRSLKTDLRRRRWRAAAVAALLVFLPLYLLLVRAFSPIYYTGYSPTLVTVSERADGALSVEWSGLVSGLETDRTVLEDGSDTLYILPYTSLRDLRRADDPEHAGGGSLVLDPAPDRVVYGFYGDQVLLYGEPANGGTIILPRLVLRYYLALGVLAAAGSGLLWLFLRKTRASGVLRQIFFVPVSYAAADLLVQVFCRPGFGAAVSGSGGTAVAVGAEHLSYTVARDLGEILIAAAAVYALLTLLWYTIRSRRRERPAA